MSIILEQIRKQSEHNPDINMAERVSEAGDLLRLLSEPSVVQKLFASDPLHRSQPQYDLGTYPRDDTGLRV